MKSLHYFTLLLLVASHAAMSAESQGRLVPSGMGSGQDFEGFGGGRQQALGERGFRGQGQMPERRYMGFDGGEHMQDGRQGGQQGQMHERRHMGFDGGEHMQDGRQGGQQEFGRQGRTGRGHMGFAEDMPMQNSPQGRHTNFR